MTERRRIIKTDFDIQKLHDLPLEEARKYFLTNLFVPVAYSKWENHGGNCVLLHIGRNAHNEYFPILSVITMREDTPPAIPLLYVNEIAPQNDFEQLYRVLGQEFDLTEFSKAIERLFKDCFSADTAVNWELWCFPLVASLERNGVDNEFRLNVLVKTKESVKRDHLLSEQVAARGQSFRLSEKYGRYYNCLTGEWDGLCPPNKSQCKRCAVIRESAACDNAYDDPELV